MGAEGEEVGGAAEPPPPRIHGPHAVEAGEGGIDAQPDASTIPLETVSVKPKKAQIAVQKVVLAWVPR